MILVAGGTGRLGELVVTRLAGRGELVRVLTRNPSAAGRLATQGVEQGIEQGVELAAGDVRDPASLLAAMSGVGTVISAVQGLAGPDGVTPASVDRDGNRNLVTASTSGTAAFIMMSTIGASPDHPMELFRMKWAAEQWLQASGVPWTIVRSSAFAETWIELLRRGAGTSGRPRVFGRGDNPVNFVRVGDVADAVVHAALDPAMREQVIEVGGPANLTLNELACEVQASMGKTGPLHHVPRAALRALGAMARPVNPTLARLARASLVMDTCDLTFDPAASTRAHPWLSCSKIDPEDAFTLP